MRRRAVEIKVSLLARLLLSVDFMQRHREVGGGQCKWGAEAKGGWR